MIAETLQVFFNDYLDAFSRQSINDIAGFYQLPCTLYSPDEIKLLNDQAEFKQTFSEVFVQLSDAKITHIKLLNTSYQKVTPDVYLVNIGWQLFDENEQLFTEFCAIYHLALVNEEFKIINVVSQALSELLTLTDTLTLSEREN